MVIEPPPPPQLLIITHRVRINPRLSNPRRTEPVCFTISGNAVIPQPTMDFHEADALFVSQYRRPFPTIAPAECSFSFRDDLW